MKSHALIAAILLLQGVSCRNTANDPDATGVFEADEVIVSAEVGGRILAFDLREGDTLAAGKTAAVIEGVSLELQKAQVEASIAALQDKTTTVEPQIRLLEEQERVLLAQLQTLEKERTRFERLVKADAATPKQLDDIVAQIEVLKRQVDVNRQQMAVQRNLVGTQNRSVMSEAAPLAKRAAQLEDQLQRGQVINPVNGTVLTTYVHAGELAAPGKPMYKIADLSTLTLRAYVSGTQLPGIRIGQDVQVRVDDGKGAFRSYGGRISWISDKAEFTPKTIQTKDERANLVYAIKVLVKNDGYLKIGMYGELLFPAPQP
jgi:HlyD family secretion protein